MSESVKYRRQRFIEAYLQSWNATDAARQVGYSHPEVQGSRLLDNDKVQAEIKRRLEEVAMSADEVLARLSEQARVDLSEFLILEEEKGVITLEGINWGAVQEKGHLIKSITPTANGLKLELHDGQTALLALAKRHGLLIERQDITSDGKPIQVVGLGVDLDKL